MGKQKTVAEHKLDKILKIIRIVIYARVSSQKQLDNKEEDSIKSQIKHCRRFAEAFGEAGEKWIIVEVISDDGRTGRNDKRDGLIRVRELVKSGKVDVVLVNRLSRVFRNSKLAHEFDELAQTHNVRLVSRMEPGNTDTANDKFVRSIHWAMTEHTSNQISEDVKRSIQTRVEAGLTNGGVPKPGYDIKDGELFIVEKDAAIIREIFEMAEKGMTPSAIASDLNERRIRTRQRKSKSGKITGGHRYRPEGVLQLLRDPIYKGMLIHNGVEYHSAAPAIVSEELWEKVQVVIDKRPRKKEGIPQERDKNFLPLKGKLRCGCCNSAMKPTFSTKRKSDGSMEKYFYYLCSRHEKLGDESTCGVRRIPARVLESLLLQSLGEIAANPDVAARLIEKAPKAKTTQIRKLASERESIRKQLKELDVEVDEITDKILALAGTVIAKKMKDRIDALTEQKNSLIMDEVRLNGEIDTLKSDLLTPAMLQQALGHFSEAVKLLPEDEQRELFQLLFKSIIAREGGKTTDPESTNSRRDRLPRRHLTLDVKLRTEAIQTLFGSDEPSKGRKSGFNIPLEISHCRKKPAENCAILSPIQKECGYKASKIRKRPKKTEHEIHRAIRWKKEMDQLGIGQNELARRKGISHAAMSQTLKLLELAPNAIVTLTQLNQPKLIRLVGRRKLLQVLKKPIRLHHSSVKKLLNPETN